LLGLFFGGLIAAAAGRHARGAMLWRLRIRLVGRRGSLDLLGGGEQHTSGAIGLLRRRWRIRLGGSAATAVPAASMVRAIIANRDFITVSTSEAAKIRRTTFPTSFRKWLRTLDYLPVEQQCSCEFSV